MLVIREMYIRCVDVYQRVQRHITRIQDVLCTIAVPSDLESGGFSLHLAPPTADKEYSAHMQELT
jgi:hypothetical protein